MGLEAVILAGVNTAFEAADDLVVAAIFHQNNRNDFDENVLRPVLDDTDITIDKVLVVSFNAKELKDRSILPTDQKVLIKGADIPIVPRPEVDRITISGKIWNIKSVKALPLNVMYILQVRAIT